MEFENSPLPESPDPLEERPSTSHPEEFEPSSTPARTLGLFFAIILIAAICLAIGFRLGKLSGGNATASTPAAAPAPAPLSSAPKPSAAVGDSAPAASSSPSNTAPSSSAPAQVQPASAPAPSQTSASSAPNAVKPAPELSQNIPAGGHEYSVQVAAVTKEEDADALVNALRAKNYPVFVVNNQPGDRFFHVQVGPFASLADAQAMRARLAGDGYNPIVKK
jgi:cell division septation protein DedD